MKQKRVREVRGGVLFDKRYSYSPAYSIFERRRRSHQVYIQIHRWAHAYYRVPLHTKRHSIGAFHVRISCVCVCEWLAEALHCVYILLCMCNCIRFFQAKIKAKHIAHTNVKAPHSDGIPIDIASQSLLLSMICV